MPRHANPFVLHTLLGIACLVVVMFLLPEGTVWWRRVLAGIFSIGLGHQIVTAFLARTKGRVVAAKAWLECLAFVFLILAMQQVPATRGWILMAAGMLWRPLVGRLWR